MHEERRLALELMVEGVTYDVGLFDELLSSAYVEKKHTYCSWDKELVSSRSYNVPTYFVLEHGLASQLIVDRLEDREVADIAFQAGPAFYKKTTSDGTSMWVVGQSSSGQAPTKALLSATAPNVQ